MRYVSRPGPKNNIHPIAKFTAFGHDNIAIKIVFNPQ